MATQDAIFGIPTGEAYYPSADTIVFGAEYGNQDFVVPMAKFTFYDAKGVTMSGTNAPTIYVRLGGTFNSSLLNGWQEAQGIMGNPTGASIFEGELGQTLGKLGSSWIEGLQKQIVQGVAGATGYVASAGQSGKTQIEFLQRIMLNNFQQLIYQGPSFRRFQLPFNMKPHDQIEAERMLSIISSFRVASSPRTGTETTISDVINTFGRNASADTLETTGNEAPPKESDYTGGAESPDYQQALKDYFNRQAVLSSEAEGAINQIVQSSGQIFTFGYPDMVKFELVLYRNSDGAAELSTLFRSEFCMIESVSVDYGAQNKMTFFDGKGNNTQYFPTDVNLTISLRESVLITAPKATEQYLSGTVLL
jgi:hypothetical protein